MTNIGTAPTNYSTDLGINVIMPTTFRHSKFIPLYGVINMYSCINLLKC